MRCSPGSATTSSWRPHAADPEPARVGRDGALSLALERRGGATVLSRCRYSLPLQVLAPLALDDCAAVVSVLNPTGGLVGGDRLAIDVVVGPAAHACLTTPSATKVYRTAGATAEQHVRLRLGVGAILEWVPDHTIPFPGSAFRQAIDCELDDDATLILTDAFAAGRIARGEAWQFALLESAVTVRDRRGPILHDRFVLTARRSRRRGGARPSRRGRPLPRRERARAHGGARGALGARAPRAPPASCARAAEGMIHFAIIPCSA